jgi:hypothetical protein
MLYKEGKIFYSKEKTIEAPQEIEDFTRFPDFREFVLRCFENSNQAKEKEYTIEQMKSYFFKGTQDKLKTILTQNGFIEKKEGWNINRDDSKNGDQFFVRLLKIIRENFLPLDFSRIEDFHFSDSFAQKTGIPVLKTSPDHIVKITKHHKFGEYFEKLLESYLYQLLVENENNVLEAMSNMEVNKSGDKIEMDIVLVMTDGTLKVLEAKTEDFEKKDEDARKYNLFQASGIYSAFVPVYLFYREDIEKPYLNKKAIGKLKDFAMQGKSYLTYNDSQENADFDYQDVKIKLNPISQIIKILKL